MRPQYELRALRKAYTDNKKLTYRYFVEVIDMDGNFSEEFLKTNQTNMRARCEHVFELFNLKTGYSRILTRTEHSNYKYRILKRTRNGNVR